MMLPAGHSALICGRFAQDCTDHVITIRPARPEDAAEDPDEVTDR